MKRVWLLVLSFLFVGLVACGGGGGESTSSSSPNPISANLWMGTTPTSIYTFNWNTERDQRITGIPFMIMYYNNTTHKITDIKLGLSGVKVEIVPNPMNTKGIPQIYMHASDIEYNSYFQLNDPVYLAVGIGGKSTITLANGDPALNNSTAPFSFYTDWHIGYGGYYSTKWTFTHTPGHMIGGATMIDTFTSLGQDTDLNAISMLPINP